jgi:hypothetical protein
MKWRLCCRPYYNNKIYSKREYRRQKQLTGYKLENVGGGDQNIIVTKNLRRYEGCPAVMDMRAEAYENEKPKEPDKQYTKKDKLKIKI